MENFFFIFFSVSIVTKHTMNDPYRRNNKLCYVLISNNNMLRWKRQPLCNYKDAIFILAGHAVSKATWCHPGVPAKTKAGASRVPDAILTQWRELPTHRLSHTGYPEKYNIHASSFPTAYASCWQNYCNIGTVVFLGS